MKGYQLTFYTQQDRRHGKESLAEWLLKLAKEHGALGGTLFGAGESFGHDGRFHSRVLDAIRSEGIDVFFVKTPVEYGRTGSAD
jgi:PII-like signaling protein